MKGHQALTTCPQPGLAEVLKVSKEATQFQRPYHLWQTAASLPKCFWKRGNKHHLWPPEERATAELLSVLEVAGVRDSYFLQSLECIQIKALLFSSAFRFLKRRRSNLSHTSVSAQLSQAASGGGCWQLPFVSINAHQQNSFCRTL